MTYENRVAIYDSVVARCPEIDRKGKTMPYTSTNGHMFSLVNKDGEIGFRLGPDGMANFFAEHDSGPFLSHGATMRGYVLIPDAMLSDHDRLVIYLRQAKAYVESLPPK
ncbi:hypothetical protein GCM10007853_00540 [Algimonas ampicilliniresistens]|jgi:hypothetical protein|uniref:TfoX N-terminal domain-containing protein n=1 Tax=Algimonas ampicilliniresistens TaxID=1298735 RepID=A0ABQ5V521_9PROT|nr:hypothetical protein [Algimonas ampicilliniresistens]GLQ22180.1 hypothetical protein GCM10007853_00540 [Algimonas ampicilliniresistens]